MPDQSHNRAQQYQAALEQQYRRALALKERQQFDAAIAAFEQCFAVAVQYGAPFTLPQYVDVMLMIGFCHADQHHWKQALEVYHTLESVLNQEGEWFRQIPRGLKLAVQPDFDFAFALATVAESIGLAYDNDGQPERSRPYFRSSIATYLKLDMKPRAAKTFYFFGVGCARHSRWDDLAMAGDKLFNLGVALDDVNYQVEGLHFGIQAAANRNQPDALVTYLEQVIAIERRVGHPDLRKDEQLLASVRSRVGKTSGGGSSAGGLLDRVQQTVVRFAAAACKCRVAQLDNGAFVGLRDGSNQRCWAVVIDEMTDATAAGFGESQRGVELHLVQSPSAMVQVREADSGRLVVRIGVEWQVPNVNKTGLMILHTETIDANADQLARTLQDFMKAGRLVVKDGCLICTMKPRKG